jgi:hypothetical protein
VYERSREVNLSTAESGDSVGGTGKNWNVRICRESQKETSVFWKIIVSVILSMCPIPNGFWDRDISLYSFKIVDKKKMLPTVSNTGIYCSVDKVGTVYIVQYIFEIDALRSSCEDMACCSSECILTSIHAGDK